MPADSSADQATQATQAAQAARASAQPLAASELPLIPVHAADDARLHDYVGLTDMALRTRREPAEGLFIAEGDKVIRRALASGHPLRSMLLARKWVPLMADVIASVDGPVYVADEQVLHEVTGFAVHRGALAAMGRLPLPEPADLLARAARVAVLEDINNHTNIGAIFRGAAALGMDAVLLNPRCADPLYRRSVKVSMGTVFAVPWSRLPDGEAGYRLLRDHGLQILALTPDPDAVPLSDVPSEALDRCALVFGAEGPGLTDSALDGADARVRIPMAGGVDSLNVAAAAAVAFYAITTGRAAAQPPH